LKTLISRAAVLFFLALLTPACAGRSLPPHPAGAPAARLQVPGFEFTRDTYAFRNEIRARHPNAENLYANYCFVLARGVRQFSQFARFEPRLPRLDHAGYVERVQRVVEHPPWEPAVAEAERIVIPGYADLREFSRAEEPAVKEGLGGRFWTLVHWTNWRITLPVTGGHQEAVARETLDELRAGRLVQWLVTNWPKPELNHTVVAFAATPRERGIEFAVWDPNDPDAPGIVSFDRDARQFWATRLHDTEPGPIRAFRMYYWPLL